MPCVCKTHTYMLIHYMANRSIVAECPACARNNVKVNSCTQGPLVIPPRTIAHASCFNFASQSFMHCGFAVELMMHICSVEFSHHGHSVMISRCMPGSLLRSIGNSLAAHCEHGALFPGTCRISTWPNMYQLIRWGGPGMLLTATCERELCRMSS